MVGLCVISWDSLGHGFFRVAQNEVWRQVILSEIRQKNAHSVPEWRMDLKYARTLPAPRNSGEGIGW